MEAKLRHFYERAKAYRDEDEAWDLAADCSTPMESSETELSQAVVASYAGGTSPESLGSEFEARLLGLDKRRAAVEMVLEAVWRSSGRTSPSFSLVPLMASALLEADDVEAVGAVLAQEEEPPLTSLLVAAGFISPMSLEIALTILYAKHVDSELFGPASRFHFGDAALNGAGDSPAEEEDGQRLDEMLSLLKAQITTAVDNHQRMMLRAVEVDEKMAEAEVTLKQAQSVLTSLIGKRSAQAKAENMETTSGMKATKREASESIVTLDTSDDEIKEIHSTLPTPAAKMPRFDLITKPVPGDKVLVLAPESPNSPASDLCLPGEVLEARPQDEDGLSFLVRLSGPGEELEVRGQALALAEPVPWQPPVGHRVIIPLPDAAGDTHFYIGTMVEPRTSENRQRMLVGLDDGRWAYVGQTDVRATVDAAATTLLSWKLIPARRVAARDFVRWYLSRYPNRQILNVAGLVGTRQNVVKDGHWYSGDTAAWVEALDASLALVRFPTDPPSKEWIFVGSSRFHLIHRAILNYLDAERMKNEPGRRRAIRNMTGGGRMVTQGMPSQEAIERRQMEHLIRVKSKHLRQTARKSTKARKSDGAVIRYNEGSSTDTSSGSDEFLEDDAFDEEGRPRELKLPSGQAYRIPQRRAGRGDRTLDTLPESVRASGLPAPFEAHECSAACLPVGSEDAGLCAVRDRSALGLPPSPLLHPRYCGWARHVASMTGIAGRGRHGGGRRPRRRHSLVYYSTPCGRSLRSTEEIQRWLNITGSRLPVDCFSFDAAVDTMQRYRECEKSIRWSSHDYSKGSEEIPISVVNSIQEAAPPPLDDYQPTRFPFNSRLLPDEERFNISKVCSGCSCEDDCSDALRCECQQLSAETAECVAHIAPLEGAPRYEGRRLRSNVVTGIFECNEHCACNKSPARCHNRVVQRPISIPLQLFKTASKGWGVRTLVDIPAGQFICVYAGAILSDETAEALGAEEGDEYFADMDLVRTIEEMKFAPTEPEPVAPGDGESLPSFRPELPGPLQRELETGQPAAVEPHPAMFKLSRYFGSESVFVIDARKYGNIGRYFNHSCEPNIFVQNVLVDTHDMRFPWVSFFARRAVRAGEEICWDYAYEVGSVPGRHITCHCGARRCRGNLL